MRTLLSSLTLTVLLFTSTALAELPLLRPAEQKQLAAHIVTGQVQNVYKTEKSSDPKHVDTLYAIEVTVAGVEKGDTIQPDQVIFAKAWQMKKRPRGWAGPSGQDVIPNKGQQVRLYLNGDKGNFESLLPNGIEVVTGDAVE